MKLLVFSDDWGRHPSSCQHLIRQLLPEHEITWVNTIGMRPPRLDLITARRGLEKIGGWLKSEKPMENGPRDERLETGARAADEGNSSLQNEGPARHSPLATIDSSVSAPRIIDAKMWPWMSRRWDRWLNQNLLSKQLKEAAENAVAITTIPIVADLVGRLPVKQWVYYCVDDFSVWPGLDGKTLGRMEDDLIAKVNRVVAVSDHLVNNLERRGCDATLLTHGVDVDFWRSKTAVAPAPDPAPNPRPNSTAPTLLFWGVVDRRMNADWVLALADSLDSGRIVLAGPQQDPDDRLLGHSKISLPGAVPFEQLPTLARQADVLIMPYADLPVTRAMQPLKLKEYLATGKPIVVSQLPATRDWSEFLTIAESSDDFVAKIHRHLRFGGDNEGLEMLFDRLESESWSAKADHFIHWMGCL